MPPNMGGNTKTTPNLPGYLTRPAKLGAAEAERLYADPRYNTLPGMDPSTLLSLQRRQDMATAGSPIPGAATGELQKILSGWYLNNGNPHIKGIADRAVGEGMSDVSGRFAGSGRVGSGAYAGALADAAMGTRAGIYGANYDAERSRMAQGLAMAPQTYGLGYADAGMLEDVGRTREEEAMRQYDWPFARLDRLLSPIYGNPIMGTPGTASKTSFNWGALVSGLINPAGGMMSGMGGMGGGG